MEAIPMVFSVQMSSVQSAAAVPCGGGALACQVWQRRSWIDAVNRVRRKLSRLGLAGSGDGAAASAARSAASRFGAIVVRFVQ